MFQFVALSWDPSDKSHADRALFLALKILRASGGWTSQFRRAGLTVMCAGIKRGRLQSYPLDSEQGVVLGTLFERGSDRPVSSDGLGAAQTGAILSSKGHTLINSYWGRYVAFLHDQGSQALRIIRSPTGEIDCLMIVNGGVRIYFSSMLAFPLVELISGTINWDYVRTYLGGHIYESRETGLAEVTRVLHGECLEVSPKGTRRSYYWNPFDIIRGGLVEDADSASLLLRDTLLSCTGAWSSLHSSLLHFLSGGLDSSIVLGCLHRALKRPKITCFNIRSVGDQASDERRFARLAAAFSGHTLLEAETEEELRLDRLFPGLPRLEIPADNVIGMAGQRMVTEAVRDHGIDGYVIGRGGDQILYQGLLRFTYTDYLLRHGPGLGALRIAIDVARRESDSLKGVLFGKRSYFPARVLEKRQLTTGLLTPEVLTQARNNHLALHPWFEKSAGVPPGKWWHVWCLSTSMGEDMYGPLATQSEPELIFPMLSQPVVEACLRIPTYVLSTGCQDRALARRSFRGIVPAQILERFEKGAVYSKSKTLVSENIQLARELLLDGHLVNNQILDRLKVEEVLSGKATKVVGQGNDLLKYIATEWWINSWAASRQTAAA